MEEREDAGVSDSQYTAEVTARDAQVTGLLTKKDKIGALHASLQNPPNAAKSSEIKVISFCRLNFDSCLPRFGPVSIVYIIYLFAFEN